MQKNKTCAIITNKYLIYLIQFIDDWMGDVEAAIANAMTKEGINVPPPPKIETSQPQTLPVVGGGGGKKNKKRKRREQERELRKVFIIFKIIRFSLTKFFFSTL